MDGPAPPVPSSSLADVTSPWGRRACALIVVLALASLAAGPPLWRSGDPGHPLRLSFGQMQALRAMRTGPDVAATAAILVDRRANAVLYHKNAEMPLPMASTAKLMTVLVALETLAPDDVVTVPAAALVGGATMGLQAGVRVRVRTLLYGALLPSGNDAAMTLALAAAGSESAFVERMNRRAVEWGLTHTHFVNPTGFDAPGQVSTAADLAELARRALAHPLVATLVALPQAEQDGYLFQNTNQLLNTYPGAYGVKTGTTEAAGQVLIAAARRGQGDALSVVLGSPDRYADTRHLLDFYFAHWCWTDVGLSHNALNRVVAPDGSSYLLRTPPRPLFLPSWQVGQVWTYRHIGFDENGRPFGQVRVWLGDRLLLETPITFIRQPS
jgi:D-alanyl-D-alanine carboxypeptidase (penicillin-binding protein 5/6)